MSVLITEAETKQGLAITQSLGRKGIAISCLTSNPSAPCLYSKYCKEYFISPRLEDKDSYIRFLLGIVKNKKYDLLISCSDLTTEYISEKRESLLSFARFLLPSHQTLMCALNKDKLMRFCQGRNLSMPKTFYPKTIGQVKTFNGRLNSPLVLKGTRGSGAAQVRYAKSKRELISSYIELKKEVSKISEN